MPMGRTTGGISGPGGKNVAPIYKMLEGGRMGPAPVQGPQLPKKKKQSLKDKIKKAYDAFERDAGGGSYY
jgi:hypothetical protein